MSSQLRIQSILSPTDHDTGQPSNKISNQSASSKRKLEQVSSAQEGTSPAPNWVAHHDEQFKPDAGDDISSGRLTPANSDEKAGRKRYRAKEPLRSSIACLRCRRSKIKCDNDGGSSPCDTCVKGGHQCQYPEAVSLPQKRSDPPTTENPDKEIHQEKKRTKKIDDLSGLNPERSTAYAAEVLSYPFLTTELWDQLLNIYKQQYATELPFLHLPSLKEKVSSYPGQGRESSSELNLVLLGILMLTARCNPDLVRYVTHLPATHSGSSRSHRPQSKPGPVEASEFFAAVLTTALGPLRTAMDTITVERTQAFLMLGLFEWNREIVSHKSSAWMYLGVAVRMAKLMRLELDDQRIGMLGGQTAPQHTGTRSAEIAIIRETRRRTMYSCFILDRLMGYGSERPLSITAASMLIQLPCSEMAFDLSLNVYTGLLYPHKESSQPRVNDDSTLSRFIKLLEIWGEISRYSSMGGRLQENHPPWDIKSTFYGLQEALDAFSNELPDTFKLSRQNYYRHENHQATHTYVSLHMLASVCQIVLNREHLPFLPLRCRRPQGPLDSSQAVLDLAPDRFWGDTTQDVFRASSNIIDLISLCKEKLPLSSLTTFSVWLAGFMTVYAHHFPHMDVKQQLIQNTGLSTSEKLSVLERGKTGIAFQALQRASVYLPGTQSYLENLEAIDRYFAHAKNTAPERAGPGDATSESSRDNRSLSLRLGEADTHRISTSPPLPSSRMSNSPKPSLEEPTKPPTLISKSQLLLPGNDEEPLVRGAPEILDRNIESLESQRISLVLNDLEAFSGAGSLRVTF
ncbi:putative transcriptional regulatory protein PB1A11.04c [Fusarium austroafricanum]|uniref:Putative transcriptional regulatory protein PB1A11.04c n=1 Tax=Fusarium austroafricanum TaxID=2364996 RepID=A0A8H4KAN7_9HYPO|nr:putative transcriptional regulatory protein PB1A11.04c [Fusarium austroafricanum]